MRPSVTAMRLIALLLLGTALRVAVIAAFPSDWTDDRDVYLGIAASVREGRGYSTPETSTPTAFRPPLYPLWLAACPWANVGRWVVFSNLLFGLATTLLTWQLGLRLGLSSNRAFVAAAIIAIDPLLLRYTAFPMTECLSTLLTAALLWHLARPLTGWPSRLTGGLLFGVNVLCRPTVWAFGGLLLLSYIVRRYRTGSTFGSMASQASRGATDEDASLRPVATTEQPRFRAWLQFALGIAIVVGPWVVRNFVQFGVPILNTTHGGYTLLLGNNAAFYAEVVRQPWGTVWDGSRGPGQAAWLQKLQQEMSEQGVSGEVAEDRWQQQRAWSEISADPAGFARASALRCSWFWNVIPLAEPGSSLPTPMRWAIGAYYATLFAATLFAALALARRTVRNMRAVRTGSPVGEHEPSVDLAEGPGGSESWGPVCLMLVAFTLVHLVYWSNARMRPPVMPAVAVLAAALGSWRPLQRSTSPDQRHSMF